jgi:hypothetical protein
LQHQHAAFERSLEVAVGLVTVDLVIRPLFTNEQGTKLLSLKDTAMGLVIAGGKYLYDKASKGFDFLKKEGTSIAGKALEWWKDPSSFKDILKSTFTSVKDKIGGFKGVSFYDKRQIRPSENNFLLTAIVNVSLDFQKSIDGSNYHTGFSVYIETSSHAFST